MNWSFRRRPAPLVRTLAVLLWIWLLAGGGSLAVDIPPAPTSQVNDYAGLLAAEARGALDAKLASLEKAGGPQVLIAIFPSLEEESLEDFSIRLAEQWKAGKKGIDNGVLVVLFIKERRIRIEVGYGLEGRIPDALAGRIVRGMQPYFRANDYSAGLNHAVDEIAALAGGSELAPEDQEPAGSFRLSIPLLILVLLFLRALLPRRASTGFSIDGTGSHTSAIPWWLPLVVGSSHRGGSRGPTDTFGSGWGGGFSGGSSGGFSGGGGGSFGGGGASGGW